MRELLKILPSIYDASISQSNWVTALDQVVNVCSAKGAMLFAMNNTSFPYNVNKSNSIYIGAESQIAEYLEKYGRYEQEALKHVLSSPVFKPVLDTDIWPGLETLRNREDIVSAGKIGGTFRKLGYNLSGELFHNSGVVFQFDESFDEIPEDFFGSAGILLPHIAKALELNRFYFQLHEKYRAVLGALDNVKIGICIATPDGHLAIVNEEAHRIFDENDGISQGHDGRLHVTNADRCAEIGHHLRIHSETALGQNDHSESFFVIDRSLGREPLILEMSPLRDGDCEFERDFSGTIITMIDPETPFEYSVEPLCMLYALTDAEAQVAALLSRGFTTSSIAEIRDVAENTIKNQIKSIFLKSETKTRSDLIRKIVSLSPPII